MHFGENQLSPLSIGISPLPTSHPSGLQSTPVRASTPCYRRFTLLMGSSSGFGSTSSDVRPLQTRFRSGSSCHCLNLPLKVTRRIILQKARRHPALRPRASTACKRTVSGSFHSPRRGSFHHSLTVLVRYWSSCVFSLREWSPLLHTEFHVLGTTQDPAHRRLRFPYAAFMLFGRASQHVLVPNGLFMCVSK